MGPGAADVTATAAPTLSYAQHGEDIVLLRAFGHQPTGFYVDVGAAGPVQHSVTKLFYDRGWSGINIEPIPQLHEQLVAVRGRDVNLRLAVGATPGRVPLSIFPDRPGLTTTDPSIAQRHETNGWRCQQVTVEMLRLEEVLAAHCGLPIDFMKIDVEGAEADVLTSFDLCRWAPRALLVEATKPMSSDPSHHDWEPVVLAAGYRLCLFDGLNRFYAHEREPGLACALAQPLLAQESFRTAQVSAQHSSRLIATASDPSSAPR